jgi:hypothetical protein
MRKGFAEAALVIEIAPQNAVNGRPVGVLNREGSKR